jgi:hypothetical protein
VYSATVLMRYMLMLYKHKCNELRTKVRIK